MSNEKVKSQEKSKEELQKELQKIKTQLKSTTQLLKITESLYSEQSKKLEESNKELERFAYVASHDLQEPLRMIASYIQLIERRYKDKLDEKGLEFFGFVMDGAKRMKSMIVDLLEYSRVGSAEVKLKPVDLSQSLKNVCKNLEALIKEHDAKVEVVGELPMVLADEPQLERLLQNLIGNGIKYRGDRTPVIKVCAEIKDSQFVVCIEDNGIGIAKEYQEKVFEIFKRLHADQEKYKGTGIGLAVCKKIVEKHQGEIWLESQAGHGSKFFFSLKKVN